MASAPQLYYGRSFTDDGTPDNIEQGADSTTSDDAMIAAQLHQEELRQLEEARLTTPSVQTSQPSSHITTAVPIEEDDGNPGNMFFAPYLRLVYQKTSEEEFVCGPISCAIACCLCLIFWPAALFVPCCPCDKQKNIKRGYVVE